MKGSNDILSFLPIKEDSLEIVIRGIKIWQFGFNITNLTWSATDCMYI